MRGMAGWIVVRTILVMDTVLLVVVGFIGLVWISPPPGLVVAVVAWSGAGGLIGLLPHTDPYRVQARRRRRQSQGWVVGTRRSGER